MDNETKLSSQQLNEMISSLKNTNSTDKVDVNDFVNKHLNEKQADALQNVMKNPELIKSILSSPQAKRIIEKFSQGGNNK